MITKLESIVPDTVQALTVKEYILRAWPMLGAKKVNALIRDRQVKINEARASGTDELQAGDRITAYLEGQYDGSLKIIAQDSDLLAFVKPRGLPTDRDEFGVGEDTVLTRLQSIHPDARLVHRLDAGTGGLMLAAIGEQAEY